MVICFHGYGELGDHFRILDQEDLSPYSLYCIDLPHHGRTVWKDGNAFLRDDLLQVRQLVTSHHQREFAASGHDGRYALMGYSLGGRVAMRLFQSDPSRVHRLVLLAPDGLSSSFWYWFCTSTILGNKIFHYSMHRSLWFLKFLRQLKKTKLINKNKLKFITDYVEHPNSRRLVYHRWRTLRKLVPSASSVKSRLREHHVPTRVLFGKFDRIIKPSTGKSFARAVRSNGAYTELNCGHQLLLPKNAEAIIKALGD